MSLSGFSLTDYLTRSGNSPFNANVVGVGFCCWARLAGTPAGFASLSSIDDGEDGFVWHQLATASGSTQMTWSCAQGTTNLINNGTNWTFFAFNRAGSNQTTIFWRTVSATALSSVTVTDNDAAAINPPFIWHLGASGFVEFWNGEIVGAKIFGPGTLPDAAQYYQESLRLRPSFQGSTLHTWLPSLNAGQAGINFQGDASRNFTVQSPPLSTSLNMPPVMYS